MNAHGLVIFDFPIRIRSVIWGDICQKIPPVFILGIIAFKALIGETINIGIKQPISRIIESLGWDWTDVDPQRTTLAQWGLG
jgi:DNA polymerase I